MISLHTKFHSLKVYLPFDWKPICFMHHTNNMQSFVQFCYIFHVATAFCIKLSPDGAYQILKLLNMTHCDVGLNCKYWKIISQLRMVRPQLVVILFFLIRVDLLACSLRKYLRSNKVNAIKCWKRKYRQLTKVRMSEWLLFIANSAICQLYHGENKLIVNEMMMRSALF